MISLCFFILFVNAKTIHVYGMAGSGKSSIVQALCQNANVIVSHQNEGTRESTRFTNCTKYQWDMVDMPGYGTPRVLFNEINPFDSVAHVLLVVSQRIYQTDVDFYNRFKLATSFVPVTVVRSRCDIFPCDELQLIFMATKYLPGTAIFGVSAKTGDGLEKMVNYVEIYNTLV